MLNYCSLPAEMLTHIGATYLLVKGTNKAGKYLVLFVLGYEILRWLRLRLLKRSLKGKRVLITGGGSGIGKLMGQIASKRGAEIVLWDINESGLKAVQETITTKCSIQVVDVTDFDAVQEAAALTGDIDILINNAGVVSAKSFTENEPRLIRRTFDVNTISHFWTCKAFLPAMINKKSGSIVTIASQAGCCGVNGLTDYCASKFAAVGFSEALRMEMRSKNTGVNVVTINPFYINTGMFAGVSTRVPFILPMLNESNVANRVISAIESREEVVNLPPVCSLIPVSRILPVSWALQSLDFMGVSSSMDSFKGRALK
eukprot:TRINITY_DN13501_c0_g1_i1.p1 TRINITY_DN13501_c0_g1~~TRINITY_DN13501_c0_g1_i1.p1  ORF type:complete len:336 (+),score=70.53 TRINITY_DN13501_c0_g1_i1:65-1009(+)